MQPGNRRAVLTALAAALAFAALSWTTARQTVGEDELASWLPVAHGLAETGRPVNRFGLPSRIYSPMLYPEALSLAFRWLGPSDLAAKVPGIVSVSVLVACAPLLAPGAPAAAALLATSPVLLRGGTIVDIDVTFLALALPAAAAAFAEASWGWAALLFGLALWCRVTALLALPCLLAFSALRGQGGKALAAAAAGAAFFAATWSLAGAAMGWRVSEPFAYMWEAFHRVPADLSQTLRSAAGNFVALTAWVGPWPLAAAALALNADWRKPGRVELYLALALFLGGGFTAAGGLPFGFPKYQAGALALLLLAAAPAIPAENTERRDWLLLAGALLLAQALLLPDPVRFLRYDLRQAAALGAPAPWRPFAARAAMWLAACSVILAVFLRGRPLRAAAAPALVAWALAYQLALFGAQAAGGYHTGYNYGATGFAEAVESLRGCRGRVLATAEFIHALGRKDWTTNEEFNDAAGFPALLADPGTSCLVYGVPTNTVKQIREVIGSPQARRVLEGGWDKSIAGSFTIWKRKA